MEVAASIMEAPASRLMLVSRGTSCIFRSRPHWETTRRLARALRSPASMSPRNTITKKLEAIFIVVVSSGLAILSADRLERSGPDRELLRQLKEMQEARRAQDGNAEHPHPVYGRGNAPPLPRYAQR